MIRVGVVDDHPVVVASVAAAVEDATDMVLVGTARAVQDAIGLARRVDVLVCDVQLAGHAEGLSLLDVLRHADPGALSDGPAVILLSGFEQPSLVRGAIERGAAGYLSKGSELPTILDAIRTVAAGGTVFTARALQLSRNGRRQPSHREIEVILGVAAGATNAEVARSLGLSEKTVESHLRRLFDRYGLLSRTELAVLALEEGWIVEGRPAR